MLASVPLKRRRERSSEAAGASRGGKKVPAGPGKVRPGRRTGSVAVSYGVRIRSALSAKVRDDRLVVIDGLEGIEPRTRAMKDVVAALPESRSYLLVIPEKMESIVRASGNIDNVHWVLASYLNVRDILKYERLVVMASAIEVIEKIWALPADKREPSVWAQARQAVREQAQESDRG
jgi:hypothetical protein